MSAAATVAALDAGTVTFRRPPFLDRLAIEQEVERLLSVLDWIDGDPDLDQDGDEQDGTAAEDDYRLHAADGPGCPISDPDFAVDDQPCDKELEGF